MLPLSHIFVPRWCNKKLKKCNHMIGQYLYLSRTFLSNISYFVTVYCRAVISSSVQCISLAISWNLKICDEHQDYKWAHIDCGGKQSLWEAMRPIRRNICSSPSCCLVLVSQTHASLVSMLHPSNALCRLHSLAVKDNTVEHLKL